MLRSERRFISRTNVQSGMMLEFTYAKENGGTKSYTVMVIDPSISHPSTGTVQLHGVLIDDLSDFEIVKMVARLTQNVSTSDSKLNEQVKQDVIDLNHMAEEAKKHEYNVMTDTEPRQPRLHTNHGTGMKPDGQWFGVRDAWVQFSRYNEGFKAGNRLYSLNIDESRCIVITNVDELRRFQRSYSSLKQTGVIDWNRVADKYAGIIIKNYETLSMGDLRPLWFSAWDVSSGCVWDPVAIKNITESAGFKFDPDNRKAPIASGLNSDEAYAAYKSLYKKDRRYRTFTTTNISNLRQILIGELDGDIG